MSLTSSFKERGADTQDFCSIIMDLEAAFGVPIPDYEAQHFVTVGEIVEFILTHACIGTPSSLLSRRPQIK